MSNRKEIIGITIDNKTKTLVDSYAKDRSVSRSAAIRLIVNEFFLKQGSRG